MAIIKIGKMPTENEIQQMSEAFGDYIKLTADTSQEILYGGCKLHADAEKILLENEGSKQKNTWGGGVDLKSKKIDCNAIINIRPHDNNPSPEILNPEIRNKFINLVKKYFLNYEV